MQFEPAQADELRACIETGTGAYVLVDPVLAEALPDIEYPDDADPDTIRAAREEVWERPVFVIPLDPKGSVVPAQYPYLVGLDGEHDDWLAGTLEMALEARAACTADGLSGTGASSLPIGGWVISGMRESELTEALGRMFRLDTEARTKCRYLRLPDPRVLDWTLRVVGQARLSAALGRVQRWHTIDVRGRLTTLQSLGENPAPLRLTLTEWQKMQRGDDAHVAVAMAVGAATADVPLPPGDPYDRALHAMELADDSARRWPQRFTDPHDRAVWAALCLLHGDPAACDAACERMNAAETPAALPVRRLAETLRRAMRACAEAARATH